MALNLSKVIEVSSIPSRVRGGVDTAERDAIYKEFFQLIDMAKEAPNGAVAVPIDGAAECNKYTNALASFKNDHPASWACLNTAGGKYDDKGKMQSTVLYAAARPHERKLAKLG